MSKINEFAGDLEPTDNGVKKVPVLPLNGTVVFPYTLAPLVLEGEKSLELIENASTKDRLIGLFPELPSEDDKNSDFAEFGKESAIVDGKNIAGVGVLARIVKMLKFPDGTMRVLVRGLKRIRYISTIEDESGNNAIVETVEDIELTDIETVAMSRNALKQFQEVISYSPNFPEELKIAILNIDDNSRIVDLIADSININYAEKLSILTLPDLQERLQVLTMLLNREVEVLHLGSEIQHQVHDTLGRSQREFFLREQLKTIKKELGEGDKNPDVALIKSKLEKIDLPDDVLEIVKKETERLEMIPQASSEYQIAYTYIDWILEVPWNSYSEDTLDVSEASKILDKDHFGLDDIKERILEFLAVLQLKKDRKSPILCFVGPPGVGKTSLGKSIAKSMGREFVRISLGGVRDEAEIRGHRRTYVGALPGRLIQGMKKAGTSNPVFMLDEIDKLANDHRGDPSSALLEVLDPQQNNKFNDHYLEVDYDLSSVMFIATANLLDTIPAALRDRMEIIRLPGYTPMEKKQIARRFLVPRQIKENGLKISRVSLPVTAIEEVVTHYTREAGVRNLERTIGTVMRKVARKVVEGEIDPNIKTSISVKDVNTFLGTRKFEKRQVESKAEIGVAIGMAWTSVGGTVLPVEVSKMKGKGGLKMTGSLGNVMKESAMASFSYIRSHCEDLGIDPDTFAETEFHVHVPDGATPKDGPSAGVTMTVALVSLLTGRKVRVRTAMTGEITLRGKVTAIGGVKEKVIGALSAGIKTVMLPKQNEKDFEDIPHEVKTKIGFKFVSTVDEALDFMLLP